MAKSKEKKIVLEREYIIPLRKEWLKVPVYKRAKKAVKAIKEFLSRHMKLYDNDLRQVKVGRWLNEEIWKRGIRKPASKISVRAIKYDSGVVFVELTKLSEKAKKLDDIEKRKKEIKEKKEVEKEAAEKIAQKPKTPHQEMVSHPAEKIATEKAETEKKAEIMKEHKQPVANEKSKEVK